VKPRLYLDEDVMDGDLVDALRARRVDLETVYEAGMVGREDHEQLTYATKAGRVVYSSNIAHFCRLHAEALASGRSHAGIVLCRQQRYTIGQQMRRLINLIAAKKAEEMHDRMEFLSDWPETTDG
jgi:hypothetical protein